MHLFFFKVQLKNILICCLCAFCIYFTYMLWQLNEKEWEGSSSEITDKRVEADAGGGGGGSGKFLPILILAHNREKSLRNLLFSLRKARDPILNPIIVSVDSLDERILRLARKYSDLVLHMTNNSAPQNAPLKFIGYYLVSGHYRWALTQVFERFEYVLILEDDMVISTDFFQYFNTFLDVLISDHTLLCVSAWNDNGFVDRVDISDPMLVHRTDVFPGLGWILHRRIWNEIKANWPVSFWDDWLREPKQTRNRSCIRPEQSRVGISSWGKMGVSRGEFYKEHISRIKPFKSMVPKWENYVKQNITSPNYDKLLLYNMRQCVYVDSSNFSLSTLSEIEENCVRMIYDSEKAYVLIAGKLGLMTDFKSKKPRTSYKGIVQTFVNSKRIFIHKKNSEQELLDLIVGG